MLEALWFGLASVMVAGYVVLDGFDFGAGMSHLVVARTDRERRQVLAAIGPFWDGNEVWLLAAGGVLFLAFPKVLGAGLSGFYLAVFFLLWTLILRGVAIELRSHVGDPMWRSFWDAGFAVASLAAPLFLGVALGNVIRGVPLGADGWFTLPLFDRFWPFGLDRAALPAGTAATGMAISGGGLGILDVYTVIVGVMAVVAIAHHGALFLAWKTDAEVGARATRMAARLFPLVVGTWVVTTAATWWVAPEVFRNAGGRPLVWCCVALFVAGLVVSSRARSRGQERTAFLGSAGFLLGLLAATAAAVYPVWLRSTVDPAFSLTASNAAAHPNSLAAGLWWWPVGFVLALIYLGVLLRLHRGKAQAAEDGEGY